MSCQALLVERRDRIAVVRLNRPPANAIDLQMCLDLVAVIDELEADETVQALVLAGRPGMFSAGLDVIALGQFNRAEIRDFWGHFTAAFTRLYTTSLATVAAMEGHAPAGGCVLALACDHRVMAAGRYKIGLNEVAVGLAVPPFLCRVYAGIVGQRVAERMLPHGTMSDPASALAIGLVDAVVEQSDVLDAAMQELGRRLAVPQAARAATKASLRKATADSIRATLDEEVELLAASWFSDECRTVMGALVKKLTSKNM